jgi:hypothetical protein
MTVDRSAIRFARLGTVLRRPAHIRSPLPGLVIALGFASAVVWFLAEDWIAAAALWVLWAGWRYLPTGDGPPVLPMAFTFQWMQVTVGLYYHAFTGYRPVAMVFSDYRSMVLIGLGCLVALLLGLKAGLTLVRRQPGGEHASSEGFSWPVLVACYVMSITVTGTVQELAWNVPALTQGILALTYGRFALLFLIFHRLSQPRIRSAWIAVLLAGETLLGFTGYFAGFREPMIIAAIAVTGAFDRRKVKHWVVLGAVGVVMLVTGVGWTGIKKDYRGGFEEEAFVASREARLDRVAALSSEWFERSPSEIVSDIELFVDRLWAVYYPALALDLVPAVQPHENGALLWRAVRHVFTPRLLFPDKPELESESEMVRKYAGIWVAGADENTSIAFGYAGEAYVDFGVPLMFLPVLAYGLLMGTAYQWWFRLIRRRELATAAAVVIFWLALYLFERSWIRMLGPSLTLFGYLGGAVFLLDRFLSRNRISGSRARLRRVQPDVAST